MRIVLLLLGIVAILIGLLWAGQGLGFINWPRSSFMIDFSVNSRACLAARSNNG